MSLEATDQPVSLIARRWKRYHFHVPVRLIRQTPLHRTEVGGLGMDLNEGGIAVNADIELDVGDCVEVEFSPARSGLPVRLRTAVRHRSKPYYGLEFLASNTIERERVSLVGQLLRASRDYRES